MTHRLPSADPSHTPRPAQRGRLRALAAAALAGTASWLLAGCDPQRIRELEEGVSTEADVRARFGEPERVWDEPGGGRGLPGGDHA